MSNSKPNKLFSGSGVHVGFKPVYMATVASDVDDPREIPLENRMQTTQIDSARAINTEAASIVLEVLVKFLVDLS